MPAHQPLDRVEIRRFRGLSELDLDGLGSFNVLLGANDVGKTSVLEALFLLTGFANLSLPLQIQRWRSLPIDRFEHFEALFHQLDPDQPIELVAHSAGTIVRRTVQISAPYTEIELGPPLPRLPAETAAPAPRLVSVRPVVSLLPLLRGDVDFSGTTSPCSPPVGKPLRFPPCCVFR